MYIGGVRAGRGKESESICVGAREREGLCTHSKLSMVALACCLAGLVMLVAQIVMLIAHQTCYTIWFYEVKLVQRELDAAGDAV